MDSSAFSTRITGLLGFNAGYVDTAGFLALQGLFTAHVTGNFVTLGAALAHGTSGALSKLVALPVFCLLVIVSRLVSSRMAEQSSMRVLLPIKAIFLSVAAAIMIVSGPFADSDALPAFSAGVVLVAAMAIQNAVQRMHLTSAPPTTLMTGTTTQVMIDLTDLLSGADRDARTAAIGRLRKMIPAIVVFACGCALAALVYAAVGMWVFLIPPLISILICVVNFNSGSQTP